MINLSTIVSSTEDVVLKPDNLTEAVTDELAAQVVQTATVTVRQWRNAGRPQEWRMMKSLSQGRLWWVILATVIAVFGMLHQTLHYSLLILGVFIAQLQDRFNWETSYFPQVPTQGLLIFLGIWLIVSPWILDRLLRGCYHLRPLVMSRLEAQYPETVELLRTFSPKQGLIKPKFQILSTKVPLAFTYGSFIFKTRVVISTGLLKCLTDEELATIYAMQLGQMKQGDLIWLSGITALVQIPYLIYWQVAQWGEEGWFRPIRGLNALIAAVFYGIYWVWRLPVLWLSRQRVYYSDRFGVELTGNPNALSRALLKIAIGISEQIQQIGYTPRILESFDVLLPIDPQQAISLGSLPDPISYDLVLGWECTNPYRHWLALLHSHPLLGERLYLLSRCAQFWQIEPELSLPKRRPSLLNKAELWTKLKDCPQALPLLPRAFIFAVGLGIILRCLFWLTGKISVQLQFQPLAWMHTAYPLLNAWVGWVLIAAILWLIFLVSERFPHIFACVVLLRALFWCIGSYSGGRLSWLENQDPFFNAWLFIALSFSLIICLNGYFPAGKMSNLPAILDNPSLAELLVTTEAVPSQGQVIRLQGKLLGRKGIENWLAQDLMLQTEDGLVKLQFISSAGPIGNLFSLYPRPCQFVNQEVTILGWFRRGSSPWIDIDILTTSGGKTLKSGYKMWLTLLAIASALWGCYQILNV